MRRYFRYGSLLFLVWVMCLGMPAIGSAQDEEEQPADTTEVKDTTYSEEQATEEVEENGLDEAAASKEEAVEKDTLVTTPVVPGPTVEEKAIETAKLWLRRLLYRGWINPTVIGAYSTYQLTEWSEATGSYGGVEGRLTLHYLGPTEWMGKDAESFQAAYQALDEENNLIEFDLIVPAMQQVGEVYRALLRVNRGELRSTQLTLPPGVVDYDILDRAVEAGPREVKIFVGTFSTSLYRGSGTDGAEVMIYRSAEVAPVEVLILGYGGQSLTYSSSGSSVVPRFRVPPPPGR